VFSNKKFIPAAIIAVFAFLGAAYGDETLYPGAPSPTSAGWETGNSDSRVEAGKRYDLHQNYEKAIREYRAAVQVNPNNETAYGLMGYAYFRNHEFDKAIDALENSIRLNPADLMSYYNLSLVFWAKGEKEDAVQQLKDLFDFDPDYLAKVLNDPQFKEVVKSSEFKSLEGDLSEPEGDVK
jgi:tetratricopeptide (TPR) repeat protein